jgi:hypothetical protein
MNVSRFLTGYNAEINSLDVGVAIGTIPYKLKRARYFCLAL